MSKIKQTTSSQKIGTILEGNLLPDVQGFSRDNLTPAQKKFIQIWWRGDENGFFEDFGESQRDILRRISLFSKLDLKPGMTVIEVGAGGDWFTLGAVTSMGANYKNISNEDHVTPLDGVMDDFPRLKEKHPELGSAENIFGDFERWNISESSADMVVMFGVLDIVSQGMSSQIHLHDILKQTFNILRPGGYFIFSSKDIADHDKLEKDVEEYARGKCNLKKIGNCLVFSFSPNTSIYVLESKSD